MTEHGSNSDRPRGRRARPGSDWSGYDGVPQDEREFPDLLPIRPPEARARDGRGRRGRHSAPSQGQQPSWGGAQQPGGQAPWEGQAGAGQASWGPQQAPGAPRGFQQAQPGQAAPQQYGQYGQPGSQQAVPGQYGQYGQTVAPQAVPGQSGPQQAAPQYAASQPAARHSAPQPAAQQPGRRAGGAEDWDDQDSDDPMAAFSERWHQRGQETAQDRGTRQRLYIAGGAVAAVVIAVLVYFFTMGGGGAANTGIGSLVTTFLPGELQQVPNACTAVTSGTLGQYLPGQLKQASPPLNTGSQSQCTWTLDKAPTYRVLEVYMTAYSPSGLASGNGSATFAAEDAYAEAEAGKQKSGPKNGQPTATVATIPSLGSSAFSATQRFSENGAVMDMATVYVRYRNVIIQVVLNGMDHSSTGTQYGPVSQSTLLSQAQSVAQQVTTKVTG